MIHLIVFLLNSLCLVDEIEAAIEGRDSDIKRELVRIQYDDHDSLENKNKI